MSNERCEYRLEELSWPQAQATIAGGVVAIVRESPMLRRIASEEGGS
jgi:hypothetical protein